MVQRGDPEGLHDLPGGKIRAADVADFALTHEVGQRAERFFERRQRIEAVNLVEVDVVGVQALAGWLRLRA